MQREAIINALASYRISRGSGVSEPLRAVDVQGIADAILEACRDAELPSTTTVSLNDAGKVVFG